MIKICNYEILSLKYTKIIKIRHFFLVNGMKNVEIFYACPIPECTETFPEKVAFQSHFVKHFTGELPGDINSLLPPDPQVPGLELHSKTFEANVDSFYQRGEICFCLPLI